MDQKLVQQIWDEKFMDFVDLLPVEERQLLPLDNNDEFRFDKNGQPRP